MSGTNPVGSWALPLSTGPNVQDPTTYKGNIDAGFAVAQRVADLFAPRPADPPAMSLVIDAGFIETVSPAGQQNVTEMTVQSLTISAAPASPSNRIDVVVIDAGTGIASVVTGTPAGVPVAPTLPPGKRQLCLVAVPNGTSAIGAANITDLRASWGHFARGVPFCVAAGLADALTGAFTPATPSLGAGSDGYLWRVRAAAANATTTPSWSPDGQGPWTIKKQGAVALAAGDIAGAGAELLLAFNNNGGSPYVDLLNPATGSPFTTGDVKASLKTTADPGWVMMNDGTIGDASSGATTRANVDTQLLFTLLWSNVSNANCPVSGGRGASAATDFAAHKTISLPKALGRAFASAGAGAGLTSRNLGDTVGEETHALSIAEMPSHSHGVSDPGHAHGGGTVYVDNSSGFTSDIAGGGGGSTGPVSLPSTVAAGTGVSIQNNGGGIAHNNMQPTSFFNFMIKL